MSGNQIWVEAVIYTTPEGIEPVYALVSEMGFNGVEIADENDFLSFLENNRERWDYVDDKVMESKRCPTHIKVYLRQDENASEQLTLLKERLAWLKSLDIGLPLGSLEVSLKDIDENQWFESWKKYFVPFEVGKGILVVPEWDPSPKTDKTVLKINPGMLFGTGTHNTTRLCMEIMEDIIKEGSSVLDIGCGSGILSILALLLGAKSARAVDIDPAAEKIVMNNGAINDIDINRLSAASGNILADGASLASPFGGKYDVVLANIVADVIIPLSSSVSRYIAPGGVFLCSGIIESRSEETENALKQNGFRIIKKEKDGEWYAYLAVPDR